MSQGKLIEIHFSETGKISGANIQTCKFTCTDYFPELSCSLLICNYYFLKVQNWPWFESVLLLLIVHSFTWKGNSLSLWSIVLAHLVFINSICFFFFFFFLGTHFFILRCQQSRVVQCTEGERSYHIFYQLCAGVPTDLRGNYCQLFISFWSLLFIHMKGNG